MCFSAGASFTSSAVLTVFGAATLKKVHKPSQLIFAGIPLFFACQQFTEGVLWAAMPHPAYAGLQKAATAAFVIMARIIWPLLIPVSVFLLEKSKVRKHVLLALLACGSAAALYYLYSFVVYPVHAEILGRHITYLSAAREPFGTEALLLYLTATLAPLFVSSIKRTSILGIVMFLSFLVSVVFYTQCLTSVWCFFAAAISFGIFYIIRDSHSQFHVERAGRG